MFVQVIRGRAGDREGLRRQFDRWDAEFKPGATGYLGSTAGITDDGEFIAVVRFESEQSARANSDRPEQGEWWAETEKYFAGPVAIHDYTQVDTFLAGGSDDAGFVQVMQGKVTDVAKARRLNEGLSEELPKYRSDVIGGTAAWADDGTYTEAVYFTSEEAARAGEKAMGEAAAAESRMEEWSSIVEGEIDYLDLRDPWLKSA